LYCTIIINEPDFILILDFRYICDSFRPFPLPVPVPSDIFVNPTTCRSYLRGLLVTITPIATGYGLDDRGVGVGVPVVARIFTSPCRPDQYLYPPNLLTNGCRGSFPGVKRQGREADHSPPASAAVKKMWIYITTRPYAFMM
jgi:hypothetical protein